MNKRLAKSIIPSTTIVLALGSLSVVSCGVSSERIDPSAAAASTSQALSSGSLRINDYDGDSRTDFVVFRGGTWFVRPRAGGGDLVMQFGVATDIPVPGDYDGDGKTDFAVFRPSNGTWFIQPSAGTVSAIIMQFGVSTDRPVPGDYD